MINQFSKWHLTWQCYRRIVSSINHSFLEYVSISKLETFFPKVSFHCPASNPSACFSTERGPPGSLQLAGIIPNSGSRLDLDPARISFGEMVRYGSSRVCLIFLSFGTTWTSKAQALLPQVLFSVVLSYSGTFQYIHIIILVLRMNIRIYSRIILEVTLGNWEAECHVFGPYFQRFDHHSHMSSFPIPSVHSAEFRPCLLDDIQMRYPSPGFLCMLSVITNGQRLPEACEYYFKTISHQFISISSKFHYWIPYISTIWSS